MIERSHRIERMRRVPRSSLDGSLRHRHLGIGMANADANLPPRCFGDDFHRARNFWRDGQHADMSARSLPEPIENFDSRIEKILRGMYAAPLVTEKRPFQMNSERPRPNRPAIGSWFLRRIDRVSESLQRGASRIQRRRNRGREVPRYSVGCFELP